MVVQRPARLQGLTPAPVRIQTQGARWTARLAAQGQGAADWHLPPTSQDHPRAKRARAQWLRVMVKAQKQSAPRAALSAWMRRGIPMPAPVYGASLPRVPAPWTGWPQLGTATPERSAPGPAQAHATRSPPREPGRVARAFGQQAPPQQLQLAQDAAMPPLAPWRARRMAARPLPERQALAGPEALQKAGVQVAPGIGVVPAPGACSHAALERAWAAAGTVAVAVAVAGLHR